MNIKISKIMGVGLAISMLASFMAAGVPASPVKAATLQWSSYTTLPQSGNTSGHKLISSNISFIAAAPDNINLFAATSNISATFNDPMTESTVYRSTNGGLFWAPATTPPGTGNAAGTTIITALAVSPTFAVDHVVVVATQNSSDNGTTKNSQLWKSTDSGVTFSPAGAMSGSTGGPLAAAEKITSISLSPNYASDGLLVAGTVHPTGGTYGDAYQMGKSGTFGLRPIGLADTAAAVPVLARDVTAIAFSPGYGGDRTIIAVGSNSAGTKLFINTNWESVWGTTAGNTGTTIAGTNPVTTITDVGTTGTGGAAGGSFEIVKSAIAVPSDYDGLDSSKRVQYVATSAKSSTSGFATEGLASQVWRVSASTSTSIPAIISPPSKNGGQGPEVASLAYKGTIAAGTLLSGLDNGTTVASVVNPSSSTTSGQWVQSAGSSPSGSTGTQIALPPDFDTSKKVYAGTTGTSTTGVGNVGNSGFSVSTDSGVNFVQNGLVNTFIGTIVDLTPTPSFNADNTLFLTTTSAISVNATDSVWRSTDGGTNWVRVLNTNLSTLTDTSIVRFSPAYITDGTVVIAGTGMGAKAIRKSTNKGVSWSTLTSFYNVADIVVQDTTTFYAATTTDATVLPDNGNLGKIQKNVNGFWDPTGSTNMTPALDTNHFPVSISQSANGHLAVGTANGMVYHSQDRGVNWTVLPAALVGPFSIGAGNVRVAFDPQHATNGLLYAVSDVVQDAASDTNSGGGIWRFQFGTSTAWDAIDVSASGNNLGPFVSLVVSADGTLYAADSSSANSSPLNGGIRRSASPQLRLGTDLQNTFEWVTTGDLLPAGSTIVKLSASSNGTQSALFAIDNSGGAGNNKVFAFLDTFVAGPAPLTPAVTTKVPTPQTTTFDTLGVPKAEMTWRAVTVPAAISTVKYEVQVQKDRTFAGTSETVTFSSTDNTSTKATATGLESGVQYFWRVRAITPELGRWSATWNFITALTAPAPVLTEMTPKQGALDVSVNPVFAWPPVTDATYEFQIGDDPTFGILLYAATSPINTHAARETLAYNTSYYWRVRAVTPTASSTWATSIFTTMAKPVPPTPPVIISPPTPAPPPQIVKVEVPGPVIPQPIPSYLLWIVILIGAVLIIALIVLIARTRRVS